MKKFIFLIIFLASLVKAQDQPYLYYYYGNQGSTAYNYTWSTIDLSTGLPYVPHDDMYLEMGEQGVGGMKNCTIKYILIWRKKLTYTELQEARLYLRLQP